MTCKECRYLIEAYLDGELELLTVLEIEQHLKGCAGCRAIEHNQRELKAALRSAGLYFSTPAGLNQKITKSLRKAGPRPSSRIIRTTMTAVAAMLLIGIGVYLFSMASFNSQNLENEILASHVRSMMLNHLTDVTSTSEHTVKPWFNNKLDFSPPVIDLTDKGYTLIGGRLDYINNRAIAALIYQRREHIINLFIWPDAARNLTDPRNLNLQGFHLYHWQVGGMTFWAISDLNNTELEDFIHLFQQAAGNPTTVALAPPVSN